MRTFIYKNMGKQMGFTINLELFIKRTFSWAYSKIICEGQQ